MRTVISFHDLNLLCFLVRTEKAEHLFTGSSEHCGIGKRMGWDRKT